MQAEFNLLDVNCDGVIDREEFKSIRRRGPMQDLQAQIIKAELSQHVSNQTEEDIRDGLLNVQQHGNGREPSLSADSLSPPRHSSGPGPQDPRRGMQRGNGRGMRSELTQHVSNQTQSDIRNGLLNVQQHGSAVLYDTQQSPPQSTSRSAASPVEWNAPASPTSPSERRKLRAQWVVAQAAEDEAAALRSASQSSSPRSPSRSPSRSRDEDSPSSQRNQMTKISKLKAELAKERLRNEQLAASVVALST